MGRFLLWLAGWAALCLACEKGDEFVGQQLVPNTRLEVQLVDTFTVSTATVRGDTFATSLDTIMLAGRLADATTGELRAGSFTNLTYATNSFPGLTQIRYDSLVLLLPYTYAYGDTLRAFSLGLHALTEPFDDARTYSNRDALAYDPAPLATQTLVPRPRFGDRTLRLRLPDALGRRLYDDLRNRVVSDQETLEAFLRGFALVETGQSNAVLGFSTENSALRLYYRDLTSDDGKSRYLDFRLGAQRFNRLTTSWQNTPLAGLQNRSDAVSSRATNHLSFVHPAAGLRTRLTLPDLQGLKSLDKFLAINHAELVIHPVRSGLRDNAPPPAQLVLYETNSLHEQLGPVYAVGTSPVVATYGLNSLSPESEDEYVFDLTNHVNAVLAGQIRQRPLILNSANRGMVERLALGSRQYPTATDRIQLRVFFTRTN